MNQSTREVIEVLLGYAAAWGFVVIGLSAWVGKVVAERIARKEKARIERDALEHSDALTRKRDVYSRLATAMRVFHTGAVPAGAKEKQEFTAAYDQACVWASEAVIENMGVFLDTMTRYHRDSSADAMRQKKEAYAVCILAMRRDAGFPASEFQFRFVSFD
jgi:hypothetical protein